MPVKRLFGLSIYVLILGLMHDKFLFVVTLRVPFVWKKIPLFHAKTKHVDVQYHFVHDMLEDGKVNLKKVDTLKNVADVLTKLVKTTKFKWCANLMGLGAHESH